MPAGCTKDNRYGKLKKDMLVKVAHDKFVTIPAGTRLHVKYGTDCIWVVDEGCPWVGLEMRHAWTPKPFTSFDAYPEPDQDIEFEGEE